MIVLIIVFVLTFSVASLALSIDLFCCGEWFPAVCFLAIGLALLGLARQFCEVLQ